VRRWHPLQIKSLNKENLSINQLDVRCWEAINTVLNCRKGQRRIIAGLVAWRKSVLMELDDSGTTSWLLLWLRLIGGTWRESKGIYFRLILTEKNREKRVVGCSARDTSLLMRLKDASCSGTIAEYFRDQGKDVLVLVDSLTRYAMGTKRENRASNRRTASPTKGIRLQFCQKLPALVETGWQRTEQQGSITGQFFIHVCDRGDDLQRSIADSARAILDGHIVLSRR